MTPTRQHAAIRVHPRCWKYSNEKFEKLIIHEMLHVLFDPMAREYERREEEYWKPLINLQTSRHHELLETTLDHIANVLYNLNN